MNGVDRVLQLLQLQFHQINLAFLGDTAPILRRHTGPPIKLDGHRGRRLVIRGPEAGHVIPSLRGRERELARLHMVRVVVIVPVSRRHPGGELVGLGHGMAFVRVDDAVLADGHGIALDVLGDALGVARLQLEPDRSARGREGQQQDRKQERTRSDHCGGGGGEDEEEDRCGRWDRSVLGSSEVGPDRSQRFWLKLWTSL